MSDVNLPKVPEEVRSDLNIIKAQRKDKKIGDTLRYLIGLNKVKPETQERLKKYGFKGETWDQILNYIMDEVDKNDQERKERENNVN